MGNAVFGGLNMPDKKNRIKEAMDTILKAFEEENLEKVALAVFRGQSKPSDSWSFLNRLIMYMNGTSDARGYRQWQKVGRHVKKGARAFHIIAPLMKKVPVKIKREEKRINENGEIEIIEIEEEVFVDKLVGFKGVPVFRYEDTEGKPLPEERFDIEIPYEFNGVINELGLEIETTGFNGFWYGSYNPSTKVIKLASPEIKVFLHELAHAVDDRLNGVTGGQVPAQEVVAEFAAAVIGHLMGYKIPLGNVREYIKGYGMRELFNALERVERVVSFVIDRTSIKNAS